MRKILQAKNRNIQNQNLKITQKATVGGLIRKIAFELFMYKGEKKSYFKKGDVTIISHT